MIALRQASKKKPQKKTYTKAGSQAKRSNTKTNSGKNTKPAIKSRTKPTGNKKINKEQFIHSNEIFGIALVAVGILLLLSFAIPSTIGLFGAFIKKALTGIMGVTSYIIAPVIIIFGITLIFKDIRKRTAALIYSLVLLVLIAAMIHTGYYDPDEYYNLSLFNTVAKFFNDGTVLRGGGVLGGLISYPFILLFRQTGTLIILTALSIITIILLTDVSISDFFRRLWQWIKNQFIKIYKPEKEEFEEDVLPEPDVWLDEPNSGRKAPEPDIIDFEAERMKKEFSKKRDIQIFDIQGTTSSEKPHKPTATDSANAEPRAERNVSDKSHELYYRYPTLDLLDSSDRSDIDAKATKNEVLEGARKLEDTLNSFGVSARVINISRGPSVTRFELQPSSGVKVSRIVSLADDIALNMACSEVRIEAPIPGKAAIGIEIPNREPKPVRLREVLESDRFRKMQTKLPFALGIDITGSAIIADISAMPHLLVAGATGSGKSVSLNNLI